jgi:hypothetical protein
MRLPEFRFEIRCLMVAVSIAGGILGWRQHRVYQGLRESYENRALWCGDMEKVARQGASLTREQWLALCREIERRNREGPPPSEDRLFFAKPEPPEVLRQQAETWHRLRLKYEQAARQPWLPVEPDADPRLPVNTEKGR